MAVTETRVLPATYIEAAGKNYLGQLSKAAGQFGAADLSKTFGKQFVAGMDPLQKAAIQQATKGIGSYQPFLKAAQAATGPQAYKSFMSPYQQDVIDATLEDYDIQAQKGLPGIGQSAMQAGAFGGARQGVAEAEFAADSNRRRAQLQAQLLQQGFSEANKAAAQQYQQQLGLGSATQNMLGTQVAGLSTLGAGVQAQKQAQLSAQQQLAQQQLQQGLTAANAYGSGVTQMIAGYPGQTTQVATPNVGAGQTALNVGSTLAGIYKALR